MKHSVIIIFVLCSLYSCERINETSVEFSPVCEYVSFEAVDNYGIVYLSLDMKPTNENYDKSKYVLGYTFSVGIDASSILEFTDPYINDTKLRYNECLFSSPISFYTKLISKQGALDTNNIVVTNGGVSVTAALIKIKNIENWNPNSDVPIYVPQEDQEIVYTGNVPIEFTVDSNRK